MLSPDFSIIPMISTSRLVLKEITMNDADDIFLLRSDERMMRFIDRPLAKTTNDAAELIQKIIDAKNNNEGITWGIAVHENEKVIGTIGFWRLDKENYRAEIGYLLHCDYWGKGLMQEALSEVIKYGFFKLNLHSIEANVNPLNNASIQLLLKMGFKQEAYFRENYYSNGKFLDSAIFCLVKSA